MHHITDSLYLSLSPSLLDVFILLQFPQLSPSMLQCGALYLDRHMGTSAKFQNAMTDIGRINKSMKMNT